MALIYQEEGQTEAVEFFASSTEHASFSTGVLGFDREKNNHKLKFCYKLI